MKKEKEENLSSLSQKISVIEGVALKTEEFAFLLRSDLSLIEKISDEPKKSKLLKALEDRIAGWKNDILRELGLTPYFHELGNTGIRDMNEEKGLGRQ